MTKTPVDPPRLFERLLAAILPGGDEGLTILGDLLEDFRERAAAHGVAAARRWYARQALALAARWVFNLDRPARMASQTASDLKLAVRSIGRQPGIALVVILTAGLAVAANTALFSVFDGLLFRPLLYKDTDRIVHLGPEPGASSESTRDVWRASEARAKTTASLVERAQVYSGATLFDWSGPAVSEWKLRAYRFGPPVFDLLGVRPIIGRPFTEEDPTATPSAVLLGYDVWKTRFGGDAGIVDRLVEIPGTPNQWRVIGVMPEGFSFPDGANFWVPTYRTWSYEMASYARLAPGVSLQALRAELPQIRVTPLREHVRPEGAYALGVLLVGTALLLLVAWVQIASLLFVRATGRIEEIGVRLALGGSRLRLVRQFAAEGVVLVMVALGLAAVLAPVLTSLIVRVLPAEMTFGQHVAPDPRAFAFAAVLSAAGLVVLTLLPVDLIRRSSPLGLLRGGLIGDLRIQTTKLRSALFVAQLAIATSLVYLTGLALRSFVEVTAVDLGWHAADMYAVRMPRGDWLSAIGKERSERQRARVTETVTTLASLSRVRAVSGSHSWPMRHEGLDSVLLTPQSDPRREAVSARLGVIMPGYPALLGVPLLEGAEPTQSERDQVRSHADIGLGLINRSLARELERFGPAVGQVVRGPGLFRVTGVIPDVNVDRPDRPVEPTMFMYLPGASVVAVVLFRLEPGVTLEQAGVLTVLHRLWDGHAPPPLAVDEAIRLANGDHRARTSLLGLIAVLTVPITMVGVAGALGYSTRQRTREFGIHLAIGAEPRDVARRVSRQALVAAAIAIVVGLAGGVTAAQLMSSSLFAVTPIDPVTVVVSACLVVIVAWLAALIPARRAARINPAEALRES
jgi:putative ABC transport system permease protein